MNKSFYLAAAVAAFVFVSCGDTKGTDNTAEGDSIQANTVDVIATAAPVSLDSLTFVITSIGETPIDPAIAEGLGIENEPTISFADGRVSASVGCNIFNAEYTAVDGNITLTYGASTKMMCPPEMREDEFEQAFNSIATYSIDGDEVCFCDSEGKVLLKGLKK